MSVQKIDTEAMAQLISITEQYRENIKANEQTLRNAAAVCDQAMGSDPIISKKITALEEALQILDYATDSIISEAQEAIRRDLSEIENIVEEA